MSCPNEIGSHGPIIHCIHCFHCYCCVCCRGCCRCCCRLFVDASAATLRYHPTPHHITFAVTVAIAIAVAAGSAIGSVVLLHVDVPIVSVALLRPRLGQIRRGSLSLVGMLIDERLEQIVALVRISPSPASASTLVFVGLVVRRVRKPCGHPPTDAVLHYICRAIYKGVFGRIICFYLRARGWRLCGFTVDHCGGRQGG